MYVKINLQYFFVELFVSFDQKSQSSSEPLGNLEKQNFEIRYAALDVSSNMTINFLWESFPL